MSDRTRTYRRPALELEPVAPERGLAGRRRRSLRRRRERIARQHASGDGLALQRLDALLIEMRRGLGADDPDTLLTELLQQQEQLRPGAGQGGGASEDLARRLSAAGVVDGQALAEASANDALRALVIAADSWGRLDPDETDPVEIARVQAQADAGIEACLEHLGPWFDAFAEPVEAIARCYGAEDPAAVARAMVGAFACRLAEDLEGAEALVHALDDPVVYEPDSLIAWFFCLMLTCGLDGLRPPQEPDEAIRSLMRALSPHLDEEDLDDLVLHRLPVAADEGSDDVDESGAHEEDEVPPVVVPWSAIGLDAIPDRAPAWRPVVGNDHAIVVLRAGVAPAYGALSGSERFVVEQWVLAHAGDAQAVLEDDERIEREVDGDPELVQALRARRPGMLRATRAAYGLMAPGALVVMVIQDYAGELRVYPPARVVWATEEDEHDAAEHGDADAPPARVISLLRDTTLPVIALQHVPYPLDALLATPGSTVAAGAVRRSLLDLWSLDVLCPRCGGIGSGTVMTVDEGRMGAHTCGDCRYVWPEEVLVAQVADQATPGLAAQWAVPLVRALRPATQAGWVLAPVDVRWDWTDGIVIASRLVRGDDVVDVAVGVPEWELRLRGPVIPGGALFVGFEIDADGWADLAPALVSATTASTS